MKKYVILSFLTAYLILFAVQCTKDEYHQSKYIFDVPVDLTPVQSTLSLDDTLFVEMSFQNNEMIDKASQRTISMDDTNVDFLFRIIVYENSNSVTTASLFDFEQIDLNYLDAYYGDDDISCHSYYNSENDASMYSLGIIAKSPGTYGLLIRDPSQQIITFDNKTDDNTYDYGEIIYQLRTTNINSTIYDNLTSEQKSIYLEETESAITDKRIFFFTVQ